MQAFQDHDTVINVIDAVVAETETESVNVNNAHIATSTSYKKSYSISVKRT